MPRDGGSGGPPQPNPVATALEGYQRDTPLITRYVLNSIVVSFVTSFFCSPAYLLANIPIFTVFKFQLYRILTSPLICSDALSLFFAFYAFMNIKPHLGRDYGGVRVDDSTQWCLELLAQQSVATVMGSAFGSEGYSRASFATSMENLEAAFDGIEKFVS